MIDTPNRHPACFAPDTFAEWRKLAVQARDDASPCTDCNRKYKAKMLDQGRCDSKAVRQEFTLTFNAKKVVA